MSQQNQEEEERRKKAEEEARRRSQSEGETQEAEQEVVPAVPANANDLLEKQLDLITGLNLDAKVAATVTASMANPRMGQTGINFSIRELDKDQAKKIENAGGTITEAVNGGYMINFASDKLEGIAKLGQSTQESASPVDVQASQTDTAQINNSHAPHFVAASANTQYGVIAQEAQAARDEQAQQARINGQVQAYVDNDEGIQAIHHDSDGQSHITLDGERLLEDPENAKKVVAGFQALNPPAVITRTQGNELNVSLSQSQIGQLPQVKADQEREKNERDLQQVHQQAQAQPDDSSSHTMNLSR